MDISVSKLREDIYNIIDGVIASGVPVFVKRKGKVVKIIMDHPPDKLSAQRTLPKRNVIVGDPDELVHSDWSKEWKHDLP